MLDEILSRLFFTFLILITNERLIRVEPQAPSEIPKNWRIHKNLSLGEALKGRGITLGTAVTIEELKKNPLYRRLILEEYDLLTPEYEGKMGTILPEPGRYRFDAMDWLVSFARRNKKMIRGHTLLWQGDLPRWVKEKKWTPEELRAFTEEYILTVVGRYQGMIPYWDVVNEALDTAGEWDEENLWYQVLKEEFVPLAFFSAHRADPQALLFYNDFLAEGLGRKSDALYEKVKAWKEKGVPIHGIGFQCHLHLGFPDREELIQNLKRFSDLGLKIHITELDLPLAFSATGGKRQRQAILYRRVVEACLLTRGCELIQTWGADDGHSWTKKRSFFYEPLLFDSERKPKPLYYVLLDAVLSFSGDR